MGEPENRHRPFEQNPKFRQKNAQRIEEINTAPKHPAADAFVQQVERCESDVLLLYSWIDALCRIINTIERFRSWQFGVFLRRCLNVFKTFGPPRFAGAEAYKIRQEAQTCRNTALEQLKCMGREENPRRLLTNHIRMFSQWIETLHGTIGQMEHTSTWRCMIRMRRLAGFLRIKPRSFILPTDRASAILTRYHEWQQTLNCDDPPLPPSETPLSSVSRGDPQKQSSHLPLAGQLANKQSLFHFLVSKVQEQTNKTHLSAALHADEKRIADLGRRVHWPSQLPFVSIVMRSYDRAHIMSDAIQSVCDQTFHNWELLVCEDGNPEDIENVIKSIDDPRIIHLKPAYPGAAQARNLGLERAKGEFVAYLDSNHIWHPRYLEIMIGHLTRRPGCFSCFAKNIDLVYRGDEPMFHEREMPELNYEVLCRKNLVDLSCFVHRRIIYKHLGGFAESMGDDQEWEFILRYVFLQDPIYIDLFMALHCRNDHWREIPGTQNARRLSSQSSIGKQIAHYYDQGLPAADTVNKERSVTFVTCEAEHDQSLRAYHLAASLARSGQYNVQHIRLCSVENRAPVNSQEKERLFETLFYDVNEFPDFERALIKALLNIKGEIVYCLEPRLPSLGLGLLANYHFGKSIILEDCYAKESSAPPQVDGKKPIIEWNPSDFTAREMLNPCSLPWSRIMEELALSLPWIATQSNLRGRHFGGRSFVLRNAKDEEYFNPQLYDREKMRSELGFCPSDRVILLGGSFPVERQMIEIFEMVKLKRDPGWKILHITARMSPAKRAMAEQYGDRVKIVTPTDQVRAAQACYAADVLLLWVDPCLPANHCQIPSVFTDAIAMKVPVIANAISDLGDLGRQGYLRLVDFGDFTKLHAAIKNTLEDGSGDMVCVARRLFLRQFSYRSFKSNFDVVYDIVMQQRRGLLFPAKAFSEGFGRFHQTLKAHPSGASP